MIRRLLRGVGGWLLRLLRLIPLIGRLTEVPGEARKQALFETLTTTIFATMPFWLLPSLGYFIFTPRPAFDEGLQRGEGLVYSAALLGPLFYVITKRYGRFNLRFASRDSVVSPLSMSFPYGGAFVTITALTCVVAGLAFALTRNPGWDQAGVDKVGVQTLSWFLVGLSTTIFFLVTSYSNMLDDIEKNSAEKIVDEQPRQENAFFGDWLDSKS